MTCSAACASLLACPRDSSLSRSKTTPWISARLTVCRHDMFNVHHQFAVFEDGSYNRIQYTLQDELPRRHDQNYGSGSYRRTYRGPHINMLFPQQDNTGISDHRVLLVLDVPGLPEASASLALPRKTLSVYQQPHMTCLLSHGLCRLSLSGCVISIQARWTLSHKGEHGVDFQGCRFLILLPS